ncbi:hypothetical protein [Chondromyces apiculatus]|uniref:Uncharacterized protein n=1 Tax=Chondromyces apiculatus DSM 436 TaxID=1192034 RepID=A0A017THS9_9BACT|nr:hypothetical protein [Chondromyces apiculatus]EYF08809.1 Hypothetical protein CAP_2670 [Chondromyces apiculatus DSM 436]
MQNPRPRSSLLLHACVTGALALSTALFVTAARADAVPPPPEDCPPGALGVTGHLGEHCAPTTCAVDSDCEKVAARSFSRKSPPLACREQGLCVERRKVDVPPFRHGGAKEVELQIAARACGGAESCAAPAACEVVKRCVPAEAAAGSTAAGTPAAMKGCGCGVAPGGEGAAAIAAGSLVAAWAVRRRGRAQRQEQRRAQLGER